MTCTEGGGCGDTGRRPSPSQGTPEATRSLREQQARPHCADDVNLPWRERGLWPRVPGLALHGLAVCPWISHSLPSWLRCIQQGGGGPRFEPRACSSDPRHDLVSRVSPHEATRRRLYVAGQDCMGTARDAGTLPTPCTATAWGAGQWAKFQSSTLISEEILPTQPPADVRGRPL